jgi:hypothetical protein
VNGYVAPGRTSTTARLLTGRAVQITRATPTDLATVRAFHERLGDTSTSTRCFGDRRKIPVDELRAMVGASATDVTLLAWSDQRLVGVGQYIVAGSARDAEVAFAVADDQQHEGVAILLLEQLAVIAHERGLLHFTATVLPHNHDIRVVFATVGLTAVDDGALRVRLDLSAVVAMLSGPGVTATAPRRDLAGTVER